MMHSVVYNVVLCILGCAESVGDSCTGEVPVTTSHFSSKHGDTSSRELQIAEGELNCLLKCTGVMHNTQSESVYCMYITYEGKMY